MKRSARVQVLVQRARIRDGIATPVDATLYEVFVGSEHARRRPLSAPQPRCLSTKNTKSADVAGVSR